MGKLRLDVNSTVVGVTYGIVDIEFNGTTLESSKHLSATVESLEYDVDILTSSDNTLNISLLNSHAIDINNDGNFTLPEDQVLRAQVTSLTYSLDESDYITLLPQAATNYTNPSGPYAGNVFILTESVSEFYSYGADHALTFNSDGIVNTNYCSGVKFKLLENGNLQDFINGKTYDPDGNEVGAP
jgi:hypothetical protein